jgi:hypothetical protein
MAKDESDFRKLLSEAPMAPNPDTVTVVGILARTSDVACFVLTLPDGRSVTLDVDAVKSAKTIAGAIGQSVVQLELDAKRVPESVRDLRPGPPGQHVTLKELTGDVGTHPAIKEIHIDPNPSGHLGVPSVGVSVTGSGGNAPGFTPQSLFLAPGGFAPGLTPFVAAYPHQADPATIAALALFGVGTRTYLNSPYWWATDHHAIMKAWADPP